MFRVLKANFVRANQLLKFRDLLPIIKFAILSLV